MKTPLLVTALVVASLPASADTYTYQCGPHDRVVLDDTANTITWNKHVFYDAHNGEQGCHVESVATDKSGAVADLCVATKGFAWFDVTTPKRHFDCEQSLYNGRRLPVR
jgi:hypothetical protein